MLLRAVSFNNAAPKPEFPFKQSQQLNISAPRFDLAKDRQRKGNMVAQGLNCPRKRLKSPIKVGSNPKLSAANVISREVKTLATGYEVLGSNARSLGLIWKI